MTDDELDPRIYSGVYRRPPLFEPVNWWTERAEQKQRDHEAAEQADADTSD